MNRHAIALFAFAAFAAHAAAATSKSEMQPLIKRSASSGRSGMASFVRVADVPLVFTGQIFAADSGGDARRQAESAVEALAATLQRAGSDLARVVRLNAYVTQERDVASVEAVIAARFASAAPAVTLVCTPLAKAGAAVALDGVAASSRAPATVEVLTPSVAILPAGAKIFISGQAAARATDLAAGTQATMAGLHRSVAHLGLKKTDIVQIKAFLKPFADHAMAIREIGASFEGAPVPPIVLIEWVSNTPTEIELVLSANALPAKGPDPISHSWFSWLTKSPRYCHVGFVGPGTPLIFIGGIDGGNAADARAQMKLIFERLGSTLFDAGSSFRHMAKATYYLVDPAARNLLGEIRDTYYDPMHPPSASALNLTTLGNPRRGAMLDMIAVPVK